MNVVHSVNGVHQTTEEASDDDGRGHVRADEAGRPTAPPGVPAHPTTCDIGSTSRAHRRTALRFDRPRAQADLDRRGARRCARADAERPPSPPRAAGRRWLDSEDSIPRWALAGSAAYSGTEEARIWWDSNRPEDFVAWCGSHLDRGKAAIARGVTQGNATQLRPRSSPRTTSTRRSTARCSPRCPSFIAHAVPPSDQQGADLHEVTVALGWAAVPPAPGMFENLDRSAGTKDVSITRPSWRTAPITSVATTISFDDDVSRQPAWPRTSGPIVGAGRTVRLPGPASISQPRTEIVAMTGTRVHCPGTKRSRRPRPVEAGPERLLHELGRHHQEPRAPHDLAPDLDVRHTTDLSGRSTTPTCRCSSSANEVDRGEVRGLVRRHGLRAGLHPTGHVARGTLPPRPLRLAVQNHRPMSSRPTVNDRVVKPVDVLTEIDVDRPVDVVAAYADDPDNAPDWYATSTRSSGGRRRRSRSGRSSVRREVPRTPHGVRLRARRAPTRLRLVMRTQQGPFPMETTYTWRPRDGRTHMTPANRGTPSGFSAVGAVSWCRPCGGPTGGPRPA